MFQFCAYKDFGICILKQNLNSEWCIKLKLMKYLANIPQTFGNLNKQLILDFNECSTYIQMNAFVKGHLKFFILKDALSWNGWKNGSCYLLINFKTSSFQLFLSFFLSGYIMQNPSYVCNRGLYWVLTRES